MARPLGLHHICVCSEAGPGGSATDAGVPALVVGVLVVSRSVVREPLVRAGAGPSANELTVTTHASAAASLPLRAMAAQDTRPFSLAAALDLSDFTPPSCMKRVSSPPSPFAAPGTVGASLRYASAWQVPSTQVAVSRDFSGLSAVPALVSACFFTTLPSAAFGLGLVPMSPHLLGRCHPRK